MNYLRQKLYAPHFLISAEPSRFILTVIISYNSRLSEECRVNNGKAYRYNILDKTFVIRIIIYIFEKHVLKSQEIVVLPSHL